MLAGPVLTKRPENGSCRLDGVPERTVSDQMQPPLRLRNMVDESTEIPLTEVRIVVREQDKVMPRGINCGRRGENFPAASSCNVEELEQVTIQTPCLFLSHAFFLHDPLEQIRILVGEYFRRGH